MSDPLFDAWAGREDRPFVSVFQPWSDPPSARPARIPSVPVSFCKLPVSVDPADLAVLGAGCDLTSQVRREWQVGCEAMLRAALVAAGVVPADAGDEVLLSAYVLGRCSSVVQPDGSRQCFWGAAYLCMLPPDPLSALRSSVDARLREGLFSGGGA